jgi:hypothetical protein
MSAGFHSSHPSISSTAYTAESGSIISSNTRCPDIILDLSNTIFVSGPTLVTDFITRLSSLPLPIKTIDLSPQTEIAIATRSNGIDIGTKIRTKGSNLGAGRGELKAISVRESVRKSLDKTRIARLKYVVAQRPDAEVSVGELAGGFGGLVCEGVVEMVSSPRLLNDED